MKIAIAGSSGLIGKRLVSYLESKGYHIVRLVRTPQSVAGQTIVWNPAKPVADLSPWEGFDAVVNLAGENIAEGRWSAAKKQRILESRVDLTKSLCNTLCRLERPPKVLVNGSATGFYGSQGDRWVSEENPRGSGFLADVCSQWEAATASAETLGVRVVKLRTGVVVTPLGGALQKMLLPFKLCLGGVIGSGKQYMSWISLDDVCAVIEHVICSEGISGPVNAVTPNPVTNEEWTKTLGKTLGRPTIFPMPAVVARIAFGEMADEMLLSSTRVRPDRLLQSGFRYGDPVLGPLLEKIL